jgi:uncharacterized membrane protein (DUF2068 family)
MHPQSIPKFDLKTVLAWVGGIALAAGAVHMITSLEFWNVVLWPFALLATSANLKPGDPNMGDILTWFLVGSLVVCALAVSIIGVMAELKKKPH